MFAMFFGLPYARGGMSRFLVENETVIDIPTGLMWAKNASLSDFPMSWNEAFVNIKELNFSGLYGFHDWKLPNRRELFSLLSHEAINPSLPVGHPFANIFTGYYWTSTSCARLPNQAWTIHLGGARVCKGMKHGSYMVWPVRVADHARTSRVFQSGQLNCYNESGELIDCQHTGQDGEFQAGLRQENNRFTENSCIVFDKATGLTWLRNANVYKEMVNWRSVFDLVGEMNRERKYGYHDWRVPTIAELENICDMGRHSPALPADHPFIDVQDFYWSSTTSRYDTRYAWALYTMDGAVGVGHKPLSAFHLWPVRGNRINHGRR